MEFLGFIAISTELIISEPAMIEFTHAIYTITSLSLSGIKQHNTVGTMVKPIKGKVYKV